MQAAQHWSTSQVAPREALAFWRDIVCKNLLEMQIESRQRADFFGHIVQIPLGPLSANFISVREQRVWRDKQLHRPQAGRFHLIQVRSGTQLTEHRGSKLTLEKGDCVLLDCVSGFELSFPDGIDALVLEIGKDWIKGWLASPEDAVGRVFGQRGPVNDNGWGATLSSALSNLTPESIAAASVPQHAVAEQIAGLLALAVGPSTDTLTSHKRALLRRVVEVIRERCHERELDPNAVATALRLSRRYVHLLFASAGTTFSQELYKCRLQRALRVLRDRQFDGVGIAQIAWNCGFNGPSHFTRRFRESFGVAPSAYRSRGAA